MPARTLIDRSLWLAPLRGCAAVALGFALAASATGQPAPAAKEHGAKLLPPQPLGPGDTPPAARGAYPETDEYGSTPVSRGGGIPKAGGPVRNAGGPAWLNGVQPAVLPASGIIPLPPGMAGGSKPAPPTTPTKAPGEPGLLGKGFERVKTAVTDRPAPPAALAADDARSPDPNAPVRGMAANGAPVYAGPPAYRWYGYGSVTPGSNPYAPTGQYPKASANWFSVTGATPGAFPVPVMNPLRPAPGSEPPAYTPPAVARTLPPAPTFTPPPAPRFLPTQPAGSRAEPPPVIGMRIPDPVIPPPTGIPTITTPPGPVPIATGGPVPPPAPLAPVTEPVKLVDPVLPPDPFGPATPAGLTPTPPPALPPTAADLPLAPTGPESLPTAPGGNDDLGWKPAPAQPAPGGSWMPAGPPGPGAMKPAATPVARGQAPDNRQPDPVADLIQAVCKGRANDVVVRWVSAKKITVCFEVKTEAEAGKLVNDISAKKELAPYQIDFCVLVK